MAEYPYDDRDLAFGQTMLRVRTALGRTQAELARLLGVSRRTIGTWEAGSKYPSTNHLTHLLTLAFEHQAFHAGHEAEEIRQVWHSAGQKVLLNEDWLASLLGPQQSTHTSPLDTQTSHPRANRLPFHPTPFFGRTTELRELDRLMAEPDCRLLTIAGPGGIGKTRLALEYNARQSARVDDGVVFVEFAAVISPTHIASTLCDALSLTLYNSNQRRPRQTGV